MPEMTTFAEHGWSCEVPATWDVNVNRGHWERGVVAFFEDVEPRLNLTWERRQRGLDLEKTVRGLDRRVRRDQSGKEISLQNRVELPRADGVLLGWSSRDGDVHGAVVSAANAPVTFILRQLTPGAETIIRRIAQSCTAVGDDEPSRWCLYGLDLVLPSHWRLEGIQHLVGLVRAVWMRYPEGRVKVDQVLLVRRYACAGHLLAGQDLLAWLQERIDRRDVLLAAEREDGRVHLTLHAPGRTLWQRLRRQHQIRHLHAWVEEETERLLIWEWKGFEDPLPPPPGGGGC